MTLILKIYKTPLIVAVENNFYDIVLLLLHQPTIDINIKSILVFYILNKIISKISFLMMF